MPTLTDLLDPETRREILEDNEDLVKPLPGIVVDEKFKQRGTFQDDEAVATTTPVATRPDLQPGEAAPATTTPVATRPDLQPGERAPAAPKPQPVVGTWDPTLQNMPKPKPQGPYPGQRDYTPPMPAKPGVPDWLGQAGVIGEAPGQAYVEEQARRAYGPGYVDKYGTIPPSTPPRGPQTYDAWGGLADILPTRRPSTSYDAWGGLADILPTRRPSTSYDAWGGLGDAINLADKIEVTTPRVTGGRGLADPTDRLWEQMFWLNLRNSLEDQASDTGGGWGGWGGYGGYSSPEPQSRTPRPDMGRWVQQLISWRGV